MSIKQVIILLVSQAIIGRFYAQDASMIQDSISSLEELLQSEIDTATDDPNNYTVIEDVVAEQESPLFLSKSLPEAGLTVFPARRLPDSLRLLYKKDKAFWYAYSQPANDSSRLQNEAQETGSHRKSVSQKDNVSNTKTSHTILLTIIIAGILAFALIYLLRNNIIFRKNKPLSAINKENDMPEDIFKTPYALEIKNAVTSGNFRLAVRLHFLQLLTQLANNKIIAYEQAKTNFDYLKDLCHTTHYSNFFEIVRSYEYAWYGGFQVSAQHYDKMRERIENFKW